MYPIYRFLYGLVGFSRSQTNGFLILLPLLLIILFSVPLFQWWRSYHPVDYGADIKELDRIVASMDDPSTADTIIRRDHRPFDINTASVEQLRAAGFSENQASLIARYRAKGGKFRRKEDLLRIYGIDSAFYSTVEKQIRITPPTEDTLSQSRSEAVMTAPRKLAQKIDINTADTAQLQTVFGVGPKLSRRIIRYRESLGGFHSMDQLREVYRLEPEVIARLEKAFFVGSGFRLVRININTADRKELATHPYLSDKAADAIVAYRFQHGKYMSLDELGKIAALDSVVLRKVLPYLTAEEAGDQIALPLNE
jgi:competence protein ComEA